ncbi:hypothetical protein PHYBLDRAFT_75850 [Phycomyces blakesleeanus NRRL 1555(-)]|uniref:RING-CH-type domain-containing protein n=2 Tax=Phycomyces blakesleeanus TaxID=4837 RepID=A0A162UJN8_PHYB8|nr:hypothetical protein PHYBLDRAFT_75850 [Phycomyces blakesleeanus NRRL 1555(-)]OAD75773.1 hypothetical protein PHYBLDRAFT_75850 [Phycomyces blakesleeanus NRRL 1555(-)]|eukprot:XP_018293813.1 hypothetical protein PHYBLDRAFT_75850 [Phycomyces blakesleeanus NRRL 1555(-)]
MSHFRCPSSSLVGAAGYYAYQRPSSTADLPHTNRGVFDSPYTISSTAMGSLDKTDDDNDGAGSTLSYSSYSSSSSSSSTILASKPTISLQHPNPHSQHPRNPPINTTEDNEGQQRCWICFGEDSDSEGRWVRPCRCSLVSHEECLLDWITENQKDSPTKKVHCPQCAAPYYLSEARNIPLALLGLVDQWVHTAAPYLAVLGLGCSMLVVSTTYGAHTVLTLMGEKEGGNLMGHPSTWSWRTWVGLPMIPVSLVASRSRWADAILPAAATLLLRATGSSSRTRLRWPPSPAVMLGLLPWVRLVYNGIQALVQRRLSFRLSDTTYRQQQQQSHQTTSSSFVALVQGQAGRAATRTGTGRGQTSDLVEHDVNEVRNQYQNNNREDDIFNDDGPGLSVTIIGALLWPTISSIIGSCLSRFKPVQKYFPDPFHRNILGGCLFVVAKDIANLVYKYERIRQRRSRHVRNYDEIKKGRP